MQSQIRDLKAFARNLQGQDWRGRNIDLRRWTHGEVLAALLVAHVATWTIYGTFGLSGGVHEDMLEAWVWGKEAQLGYFKHPPVFAWMAGAWFQVMPRADWAFYLLAALNSAAGLWAIWLLAGLFVAGRQRLAAVLVAMLTPLYGVLALKFNANSVLLASWPLATFFFIRSLRGRRASDSIGLGLMGGIAMLSKYYSALLLVTFLIVAVQHPDRRRYWRSFAPYLAVAAFLLTIAPHAIWLVQANGVTFEYAGSKFGFEVRQTLGWVAMTALAPVAFFALPLALLLGVNRLRWQASLAMLRRWSAQSRHASIGLLAFAPFLLTLLWGLVGVKVSLSYTIPIFFLVPILIVLTLPEAVTPRVMRRLATASSFAMLAVVLIAPLLGYARFRADTRAAVEPRAEVAINLTSLWRAKFSRPLRLVAGSTAYASAIPFYSQDAPSQLINFTARAAPWVTAERLARDGLLIVCEDWDAFCRAELERRVSGRTITIERTFARTAYGRAASPVSLTILMVPPAE